MGSVDDSITVTCDDGYAAAPDIKTAVSSCALRVISPFRVPESASFSEVTCTVAACPPVAHPFSDYAAAGSIIRRAGKAVSASLRNFPAGR